MRVTMNRPGRIRSAVPTQHDNSNEYKSINNGCYNLSERPDEQIDGKSAVKTSDENSKIER